MHKPFGYLCQFKCELSKKKLAGNLYPFAEGTMSIGRLDEDSEGLLLLTTDGKMSESVRSKSVEKEYYAQVDGQTSAEALLNLSKGVEISHRSIIYRTLPCKVFKLETEPDFLPRARKIRDDRHGPTTWISITINEGKYRQVRKMCAVAGFPVLRLVRVRIGKIKLGNLQAGEVIETEVLDF
ncbi:MAG: pseudouridine synthase [Bacteroidota bacterium]